MTIINERLNTKYGKSSCTELNIKL